MNKPLSPTKAPKAIDSKEAYSMITTNPSETFMIDVRTRPEYELVDHPDLPGGVSNIPLTFHDDWRPNVDFVPEVERRYAREATLIIICKSGQRAETAAWQLLKAGYESVYFVFDNFEGTL